MFSTTGNYHDNTPTPLGLTLKLSERGFSENDYRVRLPFQLTYKAPLQLTRQGPLLLATCLIKINIFSDLSSLCVLVSLASYLSVIEKTDLQLLTEMSGGPLSCLSKQGILLLSILHYGTFCMDYWLSPAHVLYLLNVLACMIMLEIQLNNELLCWFLHGVLNVLQYD
jgi:hypothetical protein